MWAQINMWCIRAGGRAYGCTRAAVAAPRGAGAGGGGAGGRCGREEEHLSCCPCFFFALPRRAFYHRLSRGLVLIRPLSRRAGGAPAAGRRGHEYSK